jgi:uncharacterized protein CbrC (UPF0167 family)
VAGLAILLAGDPVKSPTFLGVAGAEERARDFSKAAAVFKKYILKELDMEKENMDGFFHGLTKDGEPSSYIFRCLRANECLACADQE